MLNLFITCLFLFPFVQELNTIDISNKYMVSFDVKSLFTNIPLKECIDLAVSYITDENTNLKLSKVELVNCSQLPLLKLIFFSMVKCLTK